MILQSKTLKFLNRIKLYIKDMKFTKAVKYNYKLTEEKFKEKIKKYPSIFTVVKVKG